MKKLLLVSFFGLLFFLQGCSWVCRFYVANTSNETLTVDVKLMDAPGTFPIFHYPVSYYGKVRQYKLKNNGSVDFEKASDIKVDTLEKYSHYKVQIPPHSAIEIGQLQNDHYEKHDQYFINGRVFNLEKLSVSEKKVEISTATFDNYFHEGKYGEVYFVL